LITHIVRRFIYIATNIKLEINATKTVAGIRVNGVDPLNTADLLFDNPNDLRFNHFGRRARVTNIDADNGPVNIWRFTHRQARSSKQPEDDKQKTRDDGDDWSFNGNV
jgi:hypothetical protein